MTSRGIVLVKVSKTIQTELNGIATVAANAQDISSTLDVTNYSKATIFIDHARDAATAFIGAGTEYRIEASQQATGDTHWRTLYSVVCDITAAVSIVTDAEEAAGQTVIECTAVVPTNGDIVFFENGTIANSEWSKVVSVDASVGTENFTIQDGLYSTQPQQTMFNKAEQFVITMDLSTVTRLRVICNNNNGTTNQNIVWRCACITNTRSIKIQR